MEREPAKWSRNFDFVMACAGGAIGMGNVWRFPYICYAYGGGAFLIPYLTVAVVFGFPMFLLESSLGQLTKGNIIKAWSSTPLLRGIGYASMILIFYTQTYYSIILTYTTRYLVASLTSVLPWINCENSWNTKNCFVQGKNGEGNLTSSNSTMNVLTNTSTSPIEEFWKLEVLKLSPDINHIGVVEWKLFLCLLVVWIVIYFCIWKGIHWTSKVVYVTVPLPCLLLLTVLIRGVTLDGASDGIAYLLKPDISKLADSEVWTVAIEQVCFSYALCCGVPIALASHNKKHHNFYRDSILVVIFNITASFVSGFAVFSVLGYMAKCQNTTVDLVVESGPGLAFIAYPQALSLLPFPQVWSSIFFLMMFFLSIDSQFVFQECFCQTILENLPVKWQKVRWAREYTCAVTCFILFLLSIPMVTEGGYYVFQVVLFGSAGWCFELIGISEAIAIAWVIGANKYIKSLQVLLKFSPLGLQLAKICWKFVIPVLGPIAIILTFTQYEYLKYVDDTFYPGWSEAVGWIILITSVIAVPILACIEFFGYKGSYLQKWRYVKKTDFSLWQTDPEDVETSSNLDDQTMLPLYEDKKHLKATIA